MSVAVASSSASSLVVEHVGEGLGFDAEEHELDKLKAQWSTIVAVISGYKAGRAAEVALQAAGSSSSSVQPNDSTPMLHALRGAHAALQAQLHACQTQQQHQQQCRQRQQQQQPAPSYVSDT